MNITKGYLAEQVMIQHSGGQVSPDYPYDERFIIQNIEDVINELAYNDIIKGMTKYVTPKTSAYIVPFQSIAIQTETATDREYFTLPARPLNLPDNRGIFSVSPMKDLANQFIICSSNTVSAYKNSPANYLQGGVGVYPEGNKMYFKRKVLDSGITEVFVRLIIGTAADIDRNAVLNIPPETQKTIIEQVMARLVGMDGQRDDIQNTKRASQISING